MTDAKEVIANEAARRLVPGFSGRISAALVWDGTDEVRVPEAMGKPSEGQLEGTARERLVELAGRACYDSLGRGRKSREFHAHVREVGHLSVLEHAAFTVQFDGWESSEYHVDLINRPSLWVRGAHYSTRVTLNLRHALEANVRSTHLWSAVRVLAGRLAPQVVTDAHEVVAAWPGFRAGLPCRLVEPETDEEKWVTLYLTGSRGWSHELVRHGDWTAISQRSTRYVDESASPWVLHPLIADFLADQGSDARALEHTFSQATAAYDQLVEVLQPWLERRGVDKPSARKQARGAARGMLGNALETEVIFSASVAQWRHMLRMRAADAADAEIRLGFAEAVLPCLLASRYGDRFRDLELVPASDGIGRSLAGGGAK